MRRCPDVVASDMATCMTAGLLLRSTETVCNGRAWALQSHLPAYHHGDRQTLSSTQGLNSHTLGPNVWPAAC